MSVHLRLVGETLGFLAVVVWIMVFVFAATRGVWDRTRYTECGYHWRRVEYLFPGYKFGCWLGNYSPVKRKYHGPF